MVLPSSIGPPNTKLFYYIKNPKPNSKNKNKMKFLSLFTAAVALPSLVLGYQCLPSTAPSNSELWKQVVSQACVEVSSIFHKYCSSSGHSGCLNCAKFIFRGSAGPARLCAQVGDWLAQQYGTVWPSRSCWRDLRSSHLRQPCQVSVGKEPRY